MNSSDDDRPAAGFSLPESTPMVLGKQKWPPHGWRVWLKTAANWTSIKPSILPLTPANWRTLQDINAASHRETIWRSDQEQYGKNDVWRVPREARGVKAVCIDQVCVLPPKYGDCEDYCLDKILKLLKEFPGTRGAFRIALCKTQSGEYHAVLIVVTDHGWFVMDNLYSQVMPWEMLPYQWLLIEVPGGFWWKEIV